MREGIEFKLLGEAYGDKIWFNPERIDAITTKVAYSSKKQDFVEQCIIFTGGGGWLVKESYESAVRKVSEALRRARYIASPGKGA